MEKEMAEVLYLYEELEQLADEDFVYDMISILYNHNDFSGKVSLIEVNHEFTTRGLGYFESDDKSLFINMNRDNEYETRLDYNLSILRTIIHEVNHVITEKQIDNGRNDLFARLVNYSSFIPFYDDERLISIPKKIIGNLIYNHNYYFNHNNFPNERNAEIKTLKIMKNVFNNLLTKDLDKNYINELKTFYEDDLDYITFSSYYKGPNGITNSPVFDCLKHLIQTKSLRVEELEEYKHNRIESDIRIISEYTTEERLLYGLQLTNDELESLSYDKSAIDEFIASLSKKKK